MLQGKLYKCTISSTHRIKLTRLETNIIVESFDKPSTSNLALFSKSVLRNKSNLRNENELQENELENVNKLQNEDDLQSKNVLQNEDDL